MLPDFTCAKAIGNLWSTCLGVNILRCERSDTLAMRAKRATWAILSRRTVLSISANGINSFWKQL